MAIIGAPKPGLNSSPAVRIIMQEGDELAQKLAAIHAFKQTKGFSALPALDAHLLTLQAETMQAYLHVLTIRLARANDAANRVLPDTATALDRKPGIIKPGQPH